MGVDFSTFQKLYGADPFYSWLGLDSPLMYAAHKAAGGMTSVYRQIGIGCESLFRRILRDSLGISEEDAKWSYEIEVSDGRKRRLSLDARIPFEQVTDRQARRRIQRWMAGASDRLGVDKGVLAAMSGIVFEVRQGYKSKDSKRQNADIANASTAYAKSYFPCATILSSQIDNDLKLRYRAAKWYILTGILGCNDPYESVYDFMRDIVGYDLAQFFERNSKTLRREVAIVLSELLTPD